MSASSNVNKDPGPWEEESKVGDPAPSDIINPADEGTHPAE